MKKLSILLLSLIGFMALSGCVATRLMTGMGRNTAAVKVMVVVTAIATACATVMTAGLTTPTVIDLTEAMRARPAVA